MVQLRTSSTKSKSRLTANSLTAVIWPLASLLIVLALRDPISSAITSVVNGRGATLEFPGGFKIFFPTSDVPAPPGDLKKVLAALDGDLIRNIVANVGGQNSVDTCYGSLEDPELQEGSAKNRLKKLGLIAFEREDADKAGSNCKAASKTTYKPEYNRTRDYLLRVLEQLRFAE